MGMTLSKVKAKVATVTVTWDGETVDVGYLPNQFTPTLVESAAKAAANGDTAGTGALLGPLLEWWDVLDDNGERIAPTAEFIADMPLSFLSAVIVAIQEAMRPPARRG